jgi:dTDP-glucose 4,6-dehydratase
MKYLVTGGSGFLGSHLCDKLVAENYDVVCIDNYLTSSSKNIEHLINNDRFRLIFADVTNYQFSEKFDGIFHLASPTAPAQYKKNPIATLEVNTIGTSKLIKLAMEQNIPFLYVSSVRVLDNTELNCYIEAKRVGELLCMEYHKNKANIKIAKLGSVYGPRMEKDDSRVIPVFINRALQGKEITIFGDGTQTDSFCYVSDMIEGLYRFMVSERQGLLEFGGSETITILELAYLIKRLCSSDSKIVLGFNNSNRGRLADITEASAVLGWKPEININTGMLSLINSL